MPVVDVLPGLGDGGESHVAEPLPRLGEALLEVGVAGDLLEDGLARLGQVPLPLSRVVAARLARPEGDTNIAFEVHLGILTSNTSKKDSVNLGGGRTQDGKNVIAFLLSQV